MPNRTHRHVWSLCRPVVAGAALLAVAAPGWLSRAAPAAGSPATSPGTISDQAHLLTASERAALTRSLRANAAASGSPLCILLVPQLAHHEAIDELAQKAFAGEGLDAPGPARVLLVVAGREHEAAIETGQGPAGIVPEIDARRIVKQLESELEHRHHHLAAALDEAAAAIATSARATADRRRPLPPDPLEARPPAAEVAPVDVTEPGPEAKAQESAPQATPVPADHKQAKDDHSLMRPAYLIAAVVILGLALRRRRRLSAERTAPAPERKGPGTGKSIGDRRMS